MPSQLPQGDPPPTDGRLPREALDAARTRPVRLLRPRAVLHGPGAGTAISTLIPRTSWGNDVSRGSYADLIVREVRLASEVLGDAAPPVETVFFGGGTPTLLPAEHLGLVLDEIRERFGFADGVEVTTEANPESVTPAYLDRLLAAGFTRLSVGMQSAVPRVLDVLDRRHRPGRPEQVVAEAHAAGFEHVNLDLIYGAPYESDDDWRTSVQAAIDAGPDHVSAYALVVEQGTALARQVAQGVVPAPEDDVLADRYLMADDLLAGAGYQWYEISNWATSDAARCRHNELYWTDASWWGVGPGAHSHVGGVRWWNVKHPARYGAMLDANSSPAAGRETLGAEARLTEQVMLGVRRREGLRNDSLPPAAQERLPELARWGLVEPGALDGGRVVLTRRGRLLADSVTRELLPLPGARAR